MPQTRAQADTIHETEQGQQSKKQCPHIIMDRCTKYMQCPHIIMDRCTKYISAHTSSWICALNTSSWIGALNTCSEAPFLTSCLLVVVRVGIFCRIYPTAPCNVNSNTRLRHFHQTLHTPMTPCTRCWVLTQKADDLLDTGKVNSTFPPALASRKFHTTITAAGRVVRGAMAQTCHQNFCDATCCCALLEWCFYSFPVQFPHCGA